MGEWFGVTLALVSSCLGGSAAAVLCGLFFVLYNIAVSFTTAARVSLAL